MLTLLELVARPSSRLAEASLPPVSPAGRRPRRRAKTMPRRRRAGPSSLSAASVAWLRLVELGGRAARARPRAPARRRRSSVCSSELRCSSARQLILELLAAWRCGRLGRSVSSSQLLEQPRARLLVDLGDDVLGEVEHPLQVARGDVEQQAEPAGRALDEPDVADRARRARCGPCARAAPWPAPPRRRTCRRRCPCSGRACTCRSSTPSPCVGPKISRRRGRPSRACSVR